MTDLVEDNLGMDSGSLPSSSGSEIEDSSTENKIDDTNSENDNDETDPHIF